MEVHAFTVNYNGLSNKIFSEATILANGKTYNTKMALWDTGATDCCISKRIIKELGMMPSGTLINQTSSGEVYCNEYFIDLLLSNGSIHIKDICVAEAEIGNQGIDILIGMSVIMLGDFSITNHNGQTVFSFRVPSQETIDYVKITDKNNSNS